MRLSHHFGRTLRDAPADAATISHALMVRAGLARLLAPGAWGFLPLGWRVVRRLEAFLREAMEAVGAEEIRLPAPVHADREQGLPAAPEEMIAALALREVESYKDLPRAVYQIQASHESRGGLIRRRESWKHSAYSLHADAADLEVFYQKACAAYQSVLTRSGLDASAVAIIDGHAFVISHPQGEAQIARCGNCGYAATVEAAVFARGEAPRTEPLPMEKVATPECKTIADLCAFLHIRPEETLKAVFYTADAGFPTEKTLLVMLRGDLEVGEAKLLRAIPATTLQPASEFEIRQHIGAESGYASPIGIKADALVIGDTSLEGMINTVTGANEAGYHVINATFHRDFEVTRIEDIAQAYEGAACARCDGAVSIEPAIELGRCVHLGTGISKAAGAAYLDVNGVRQPVVIGQYEIGVDGLLAALIETHHDAQGIVWSGEVAPYDVHLVAIAKDEATTQAAERLYGDLQAAGVDVLYDDRNLSPGVMFADADLIGLPLRLTVSQRSLGSGGVEIKWRRAEERSILPLEGAPAQIAGMVAGGKERG